MCKRFQGVSGEAEDENFPSLLKCCLPVYNCDNPEILLTHIPLYVGKNNMWHIVIKFLIFDEY